MCAATSSISAMALVSFITGIFGLFFFGSLIAVICGHLARSHILKSHGVLGGDGFAVAGLGLGYIGLSFWLVFFFGVVSLGTLGLLDGL
jgi:hypothetical protein